MGPSPDERRDRWLAAFARRLAAAHDAEPDVRDSIVALCRGIDRGGLSPNELKSSLDQLDELLMGEIARRHR